MKHKKLLIGVLALVVVVVILFFTFRGSATGNVVSQEIIDSSDSVKIPLSQLSQKAKWFDYNSDGVNIKYFAVKASDSDDSVKTAFDACDVCGGRKGYRQKGMDMICNNCGNYYPISGLGTRNLRGGGCWPGYLPSRIEGDYLVLKKSDIDTGRKFFT
jgi:uncharacterized membrane protein